MDLQVKDEIKKRLKEGWIQTVMMIEVMAVSEEAAKSALEKHVDKMEKEKKSLIGRRDYKPIQELEKPFPNIEKGYSYIVELEILAENFETLLHLAMTYGPTSIEILSPKEIKMDMGEAQGVLVSVADLIHRFSRMQGGATIDT